MSFASQTTSDFKGDHLNVKMFGASNAGIASATAAINSALTACRNEGGKSLRIPAGSYLIDGDGLDFTRMEWAGMEVRGEGRDVTKLVVTGNIGLDLGGSNGLVFRDFEIQGIDAGVGIFLYRHALEESDVNGQNLFENIHVTGTWLKAGAYSVSSEQNNWIGCRFVSDSVAPAFATGPTNFLAVAAPRGTLLESTNVLNTMVGCQFANRYADAAAVACLINGTSEMWNADGCTFTARAKALHITGPTNDYTYGPIIIRNSHFENYGWTSPTFYGIYIDDTRLLYLRIEDCNFAGGSGSLGDIYQVDQTGYGQLLYCKIANNVYSGPSHGYNGISLHRFQSSEMTEPRWTPLIRHLGNDSVYRVADITWGDGSSAENSVIVKPTTPYISTYNAYGNDGIVPFWPINVTFGTTYPATGPYGVQDIVFNTQQTYATAAQQPLGWRCQTARVAEEAGEAGDWIPFGFAYYPGGNLLIRSLANTTVQILSDGVGQDVELALVPSSTSAYWSYGNATGATLYLYSNKTGVGTVMSINADGAVILGYDGASTTIAGPRISTPGDSQAVVATSTIACATELKLITAAAPVTLTSTPTIAAGVNGQFLRLVNVGGEGVTLQDAGTLSGSGLSLTSPTITLLQLGSVDLFYSTISDKWIQTSVQTRIPLVALLQGTHAQRLASYPASSYADGTEFWETDRNIRYVVKSAAWYYSGGTYYAGTSPSGLAFPSDLGFQWVDTDTNILRRAVESLAGGSIYFAYVSGHLEGSLSGLPSVNSLDAGFLFYATDYGHAYRWSGSAWTFAPGDPGSGYIVAGIATPTGGLWALCDGSAATVAQANGGTANVTTPDLNDNIFILGGTYTGSQDAASAPTWEAEAATDAADADLFIADHTGVTDTAVSGAASRLTSGSHSITDNGHAHALSATAALKVPSEANGGLPIRMKLQWYMRR